VISVVDERRALLASWLSEQSSFKGGTLSLASADASFRRYFRLQSNKKSFIVMDAPPELEDSLPFVQIGKWMKESGINVPEIFAKDLDRGFLVLSDFGDFHFQDALKNNDPEILYSLAIDQIVGMQNSLSESKKNLPTFDPSWQHKELDIFHEWCLPGVSKEDYRNVTNPLVDAIDQIPKGFMHRDFHCRNLLYCKGQKLGIIDFQGAMHGPLTYDLVSLLRDCYIDNPPRLVDKKVKDFIHRLKSVNANYIEITDEEFIRWFDLAGLQRHLKCVGIFHRLKIRDEKPQYLNDVPCVLKYINLALERNPEFKSLKDMVEQATILK